MYLENIRLISTVHATDYKLSGVCTASFNERLNDYACT